MPTAVTHYTLQSKACEKEYGQIVRTPVVVGRGGYLPPFSLHISFIFGGSKPPPYKVAVGKTCFMEDIPSPPCCYLPFFLLPYAEHPPQDGSNDGGGAQDDDLHGGTFLSLHVYMEQSCGRRCVESFPVYALCLGMAKLFRKLRRIN